MEGIGTTPHPQMPLYSQSKFVEKHAELKTSDVGKSILKRSSDLKISPRKQLRFDEDVTHQQTLGKVEEDGIYRVSIITTTLPLIEEKFGEFMTKEDIRDLETTIQDIANRFLNNIKIDDDEFINLPAHQGYLQRLDKMFDGSASIKSLAKPSNRNGLRDNEELSAGYLTGTLGLSKIQAADSPSWQDQDMVVKLDALHQKALRHFEKRNKFNVSTNQLNAMMEEKRTFDREVTFTLEEIGQLYMDLQKKKNDIICIALKESVSQEKKMKVLEAYEEEIKGFLEKRLDLEFGEESLDAVYSDISKKDIKDYINNKYKAT